MNNTEEKTKSVLIDEGTFMDYEDEIMKKHLEKLSSLGTEKPISPFVLLGIGMELTLGFKELRDKIFREDTNG